MADDLALPLYPEVEARKHLSKKQKAQVVLRQNGRCAGCGIKPRAWEFDHTKARWKGDVDQSDLNGWQAFGSRRECHCHRDKTAAEAAVKHTLRALGAELVLVPAAPYSNPGHFVHTSRRLAEETDNAVWANQFDNIANRRAHIETTAEEIWAQMEGRVDGFTCAAGTGGTIAGVGLGLKAKDENVTIALTDPHGASLYNFYANGELSAEGTSVAEGIGQGRITANLDGAPIDTQFRISDEEGMIWVRRLLAEEGLCLGLSSGINVAGAVALGKQLGPKARIATILCDTGFRYLSTIYNPEWMRSKNLDPMPWQMDSAAQ